MAAVNEHFEQGDCHQCRMEIAVAGKGYIEPADTV